ncbi:outer membrane beta-barrel protein [Marivirga sp. S37H4]|uniref:Outer membrane beta-barrel protein n=1 Tax=Marivirga aurantiaca TaxID=2802615 RepID=A0A934X0W1_9BACT|nr:outer membrane beta-barrel protein [Marivirga aurantiaca]MBK6266436.1 outer membrane beta-barrel protein [Marivirga aurantiaca]
MFRLLYCLFFLFPVFNIQAQSTYDRLNKNPFKQTQWYIGVRGGANYNLVNPINRHSVIKPTNDLDEALYEKSYQSVENIGVIYGLTAMFQFDQKFVVGTNLSINQVRFNYLQDLPADVNSISFDHQHDFQYFDVPVFFRVMFRPATNRFWNNSSRKPKVPAIIPFLQVGLNFSILMDAEKSVERSISQDGLKIQDLSFSENVDELLNPFTAGIFAGGGFRFRLGNIYLTTEVNFRQGFSNVTDTERRFANQNLIDNAYDVFDDKNFQSFEVLVGILVPLKYLSTKEFIPIEI